MHETLQEVLVGVSHRLHLGCRPHRVSDVSLSPLLTQRPDLTVFPSIFVGIPNIAQSKLDDSKLEVDGIHVVKTRENSYEMSINSTIRSKGGVSAKIRPFVGEMYLEDLEPHTPFVMINFPETTSTELQTVNKTQEVDIFDMDAFATFNTWLLGNESVRVTIKGDTAVRVSGVARDFGVTFKKTITLKGLNHFSGLTVTQSALSLTPDENGDNFVGFVDIPNPSVLTIEIVSCQSGLSQQESVLIVIPGQCLLQHVPPRRTRWYYFHRQPRPLPRHQQCLHAR